MSKMLNESSERKFRTLVEKFLREVGDEEVTAPSSEVQTRQVPTKPAPKKKEQPVADEASKDMARVEYFFRTMAKNNALMSYVKSFTPIGQAQAIVRFAKLVGVPESRLNFIISSLKASVKVNR